MTVGEFIRKTQDELDKKSLHYSNSKEHARQLVLRTLDLSPTELFLKEKELLTVSQVNKLTQVLERRLSGEPLQYILGFEYFYDSRFEVGPGCLIPRKETEQLVDEVLIFDSARKLKVAELGAGSGNIGISLILKRPETVWHAFEINPESIPYAKRNMKNLLSDKASYFLRQEDFFVGAPNFAPYDILVSNPPYISLQEFEELPLEVKKEPTISLKAGQDGLEIILKLIQFLPLLLKPNGLFLCEIGASQEGPLKRELTGRSEKFEILKDLAGLPRVLKIKF